ncbi:hypothetical protein CR513_21504, partial [Mucuna pruriens]
MFIMLHITFPCPMTNIILTIKHSFIVSLHPMNPNIIIKLLSFSSGKLLCKRKSRHLKPIKLCLLYLFHTTKKWLQMIIQNQVQKPSQQWKKSLLPDFSYPLLLKIIDTYMDLPLRYHIKGEHLDDIIITNPNKALINRTTRFKLKILGDLNISLAWKLSSHPKGFTYTKGNILFNIGFNIPKPTTLLMNLNLKLNKLTTNPTTNKRIKHIDIDCNFLRYINSNLLNLVHLSSSQQLVDILMNVLTAICFNELMFKLSVLNNYTSQIKEEFHN